jgi:hypothetical protein
LPAESRRRGVHCSYEGDVRSVFATGRGGAKYGDGRRDNRNDKGGGGLLERRIDAR